ncbi:DUF397 domain-containing protein [Streptomyces ardesiacus]|uniref:DUF397 domain-containing protein n=1 Tax=Streptomyces ardesiacus TaxID=285564 RepID=UPI0036F081CA
MAHRKDIDGSTSVPTFYGKELMWQRERAEVSRDGDGDGPVLLLTARAWAPFVAALSRGTLTA